MSPRTLLANAQDDLEQMRAGIDAYVDHIDESHRVARVHIAHLNRMHAQATEAVRSARRAMLEEVAA